MPPWLTPRRIHRGLRPLDDPVMERTAQPDRPLRSTAGPRLSPRLRRGSPWRSIRARRCAIRCAGLRAYDSMTQGDCMNCRSTEEPSVGWVRIICNPVFNTANGVRLMSASCADLLTMMLHDPVAHEPRRGGAQAYRRRLISRRGEVSEHSLSSLGCSLLNDLVAAPLTKRCDNSGFDMLE